MDVGTVINTMRDPAGVPATPVLFQVLAVATWVFHIAFVMLTMGTGVLAVYAFFKRPTGPFWEQLSLAGRDREFPLSYVRCSAGAGHLRPVCGHTENGYPRRTLPLPTLAWFMLWTTTTCT